MGLIDEAIEGREQIADREIESHEEYYGECKSYTRESIHARAEGYAQETGYLDDGDVEEITNSFAEENVNRDYESDEYDGAGDYALCVECSNEGTTWYIRKW
jgi:hypothetical protein